jgi:ADP-ribose pyrophosphatase
MREEKWKELKKYIKELKAVKLEKIEKRTGFLSVESYKVTFENKQIIFRDLLKKGENKGHVGASAILPVTKEGNVILVVQPRVFTKTKVGIEIPAGYIDKGEGELDGAKRELEEETAYKSNKWKKLISWYQDESCYDGFIHSFLAIDCEKTGVQNFDEDEFIRLFECSVPEAYELLEKGYISGGGSILTMELGKKYLKKWF